MMKNILSKFLFASILVLLFSACESWLNKVEFKELPSNYKPVYEEGDTLLYISILTQEVDSFIVSEIGLDTVLNGPFYIEHSFAQFTQIDQDAEDVLPIFIGVDPDGLFFRWDEESITFYDTDVVLDTTIQGFDYEGLFVARKYRQDTITETLHKVYIDRQYGLIKFTYNNLDSYEQYSRPE